MKSGCKDVDRQTDRWTTYWVLTDGGADDYTVILTHTGTLPEGHEWTEDAVEMLRAMLDGETPLQLQRSLVIHNPAEP